MAVTLNVDNADATYVVEHYRALAGDNATQPHTLIVKRLSKGSGPTKALVVWLSDDDAAALIQSMLEIKE